jgi:hypothetical protein
MSGTIKLGGATGSTGGQVLFATSGTSGQGVPATGYGSLYYGSDKQLRLQDDAGAITILGAGGGGGTSGSSGTSGINGSSGTSGNSGTSGTSGADGLGISSKNIEISAAAFTYSAPDSTATITFAQPFGSTNYSIQLTWKNTNSGNWFSLSSGAGIAVKINNKTAAGFDIVYSGFNLPGVIPGYVAYITAIALAETAVPGTSGVSGSSGTSGTGGATTINNNAATRVITGSNTADTLNGESLLGFGVPAGTLIVNGISIGRGGGDFSTNLAIGSNSPMAGVTTGERNLGIATSAGNSLTTGYDNTFISLESGNKITTGNTNTCIGNYTLNNATGANSNCLIGYGGLEAATGTVNNNTICGVSSLYSLPSGSYNTVLGCDNGSNLITGASNNNTIVGARINTGGTSVSDSIFIGDGNGTVRLKFDNTGALALTGPAVSSSSTNTVTNKIAITVNGTLYYLLASTSGA